MLVIIDQLKELCLWDPIHSYLTFGQLQGHNGIVIWPLAQGIYLWSVFGPSWPAGPQEITP